MAAAQGDWQHEVFRELGGPRGGVPPVPPVAAPPEVAQRGGGRPESERPGTAGPAAPATGGVASARAGAAEPPARGEPEDARPRDAISAAEPAAPGQPGHLPGQPVHAPGQPGHAPGQPGPAGGQPEHVPGQPAPTGPPAPYADARPPAPYADARPLVTPESVPLVPPELAGAEGPVRRGEGPARRAGRALARLVSSAARESAALTEAVRAIQQPVTTGRQIAVTSIRGGSGKSTVAALLALTYAHYRADPVLAVEADPALGTLPRRLGASEVRWTCADLARIVDPSMRITDLTGYLVPHASGGWLLPGSQGAVGAQLDVDTYRTVMTSVRRYFGTTVVDCETLPATVARTALTTTQARVLVTPATVEGVAATRAVLDWVGGLHRSMLPTTVVVLNHTVPHDSLKVGRAVERLEAGGARVVALPYDRHLAPGGEVRTRMLAQRTVEATARLAATVLERSMARERRR
ncbi:MinD/ParA family protein [Streptomyces buecherae]|uniref:MinD/ParA family ATP-binding protein n=1 Tax=Streptomyces buecherae TaxID=2763006 RepID=UPI0018E0B950|nr:MinD/ParA family protein [Streptomyces buecherae]